MNLTLGQRLKSGLGLLLAVLLILGANSLYRIAALNTQIDTIVDGTSNAMAQANEIRYLIAELQAELRQVVIASAKQDTNTVKSTLQEIRDDRRKLDSALDTLSKTTVIEDIASRCQSIRGVMRDWAAQAERVETFANANSTLEAVEASDQARTVGDNVTRLAEDIVRLHGQALENDKQEARSAFSASWMTLALILLAALGAAAWVFMGIHRSDRVLRGTAVELRDGAEHVLHAAAQVASSSSVLSQGASSQAASLEETSASMEEMASMTRQNAENALQAAGLMNEVSHKVDESNQTLTAMVHAMSSIRESSTKVSKIIKTIDEIAFQTNILALNAAVEAARAGEAGMGFAVVADEVRSLAQRSAQAAKDTAVLIEESIGNSQEGERRVEQVTRSIGAITATVSTVKGLVDEVSVASQQQSQGLDQVTQAVAQMEKVTQSTTATAEESAAASEELKGQAETTLGLVASLEQLVGTSARTPGAAAARRSESAPQQGGFDMGPEPKAAVLDLGNRPRRRAGTAFDKRLVTRQSNAFGPF
jgi:methyl-accepting chemotaxis protein/methyl-accepting chemotaxis protein-1 (serine sensor receptor)